MGFLLPSALVVRSGFTISETDHGLLYDADAAGVVAGETKWIELAKGAAIRFLHDAETDLLDLSAVNLVSPIIPGISNSEWTFYIAWDGSKEGWGTSDGVDEALKSFCLWMDDYGFRWSDDRSSPFDYVWLRYGGDGRGVTVLRHSDDMYESSAVAESQRPAENLVTLYLRDGSTVEVLVAAPLTAQSVHELLSNSTVLETTDGDFVRTVDVWKVGGKVSF